MRKMIMVLALTTALSGCASNGYYSNNAPAGYYYSDPGFCSSGRPICPLIIGAAIVGAVALAAH